MQQQQQQVLPLDGADAAGVQPVVQAAKPELPEAEEIEPERPRLMFTQYMD